MAWGKVLVVVEEEGDVVNKLPADDGWDWKGVRSWPWAELNGIGSLLELGEEKSRSWSRFAGGRVG